MSAMEIPSDVCIQRRWICENCNVVVGGLRTRELGMRVMEARGSAGVCECGREV